MGADGETTIDTLVFSGGGADGPLFIGAIKALIDHGKVSYPHVKTAVGYSVGSILAVMVGMRMAPAEMESSMLAGFRSGAISKLDLNNLLNMPIRLGIDDGHNVMSWLGQVMADHGIDRNITLRRFNQITGANVVIAVTNLTHTRTEFLDAHTAPDLPVLKAVRMSISIPLLFTPVPWNGSIYIDGAAMNTKYLDVHKPAADGAALELNIVYECAPRLPQEQQQQQSSLPNFQTYMLMLYRIVMSSMDRVKPRNTAVINIPSIATVEDSPVKYNLMSLQIETVPETEEAMAQFVRAGYNATHAHFFSSDQ